MRRVTYICRTDLGAYRPFGVGGAPAIDSAEQIFDVVERRLSIRRRRIFAEPVSSAQGASIDWWTDTEGEVTPFQELSPQRQEAVRAELQEAFAEISASADALIAAQKGDSTVVGELLKAAMISPAPEGLFLVGDQPVLTSWAHEPNRNQVAPFTVPGKGEAPPIIDVTPDEPSQPDSEPDPQPSPEPETEREWRWWLFAVPAWLRWLLLALLLLLLLFFLLRGCEISLPNLPNLPGVEGSASTGDPARGSKEPAPATGEPSNPDAGQSEADLSDGSGSGPDSGAGVDGVVVAPQGGAGSARGGSGGSGSGSDDGAEIVVAPPSLHDGGTGSGDPGIAPRSEGNGTTIVIPPDLDAQDLSPEARAAVQSLEEARARERELRRRVGVLEAQIAAKQRACTPDVCGGGSSDGAVQTPTAPTSETEAGDEPRLKEEPPTETSPASREEAASADEAPVDPETAPQGDPQPEQQSEPSTAAQTPPVDSEQTQESEACELDRQPWEAPEVVVVMDGSGSMGLAADTPPAVLRPLLESAQAGDARAVRELAKYEGARGERLIDRAQDALGIMIDSLPSDVDVGFIDFGACDSVVNHAFYDATQREDLKAIIERTEPRDGTPLSRALERAGRIIKGRTPDEKGVIIVLTDGYDTCGGDVCAVAQRIASEKPGVVVNVLNLGAGQTGRCIADATGGLVFDVSSLDNLPEAIVAASEEPPVPAACRQR